MRKITVTLAIALMCVLAACSGESEESNTGMQNASTPDSQHKDADASLKTAYIIRDGAPLMSIIDEKKETDKEGNTVTKYTIGDKKNETARRAVILDKITLTSEKVSAYSNWFAKETEWNKIITKDGKEYWCSPQYYSEGNPGVVFGSSIISYSTPDIKKPTTAKFSQASIIIFNEVPGEAGFLKVDYVITSDPDAKIKGNVSTASHYIKREEVSVKNDDIESAILYYLSMISKETEIKKTLLETAVKTYPASSLILVISDALDELAPKSAASVATAAKGQATLLDDASVYADIPSDPAFAANIGVAKKGAIVNVLAKSQEGVEVDGVSGYWVQIDSPKGWVFSSKLSIAE